MTLTTLWLTVFLVLAVLANRAFHFDEDVSATSDPDPWTSIDKVAHFFGGAAICLAYVLAGTFIWLSLVFTAAIGGAGWEWSQKYHSKRDAIAVAAGALLAAIYVYLVAVIR